VGLGDLVLHRFKFKGGQGMKEINITSNDNK